MNQEDSNDFSKEEAQAAIPTTCAKDFITQVTQQVDRLNSRILKQEMRRRNEHLYCRTYLGVPGEPDKVLIYQIDWVNS